MKDQLKTIREGIKSALEAEVFVDKPVRRALLDAIKAARQLEAMVWEQKPYGTVTVVRNPGCAEQHWFYRWPDPPYLDNAAECHTVYAAPVAQQPLITVEDSLRFRLDCTKERLEAAEQECSELRAKLKAQQPQAETAPCGGRDHCWRFPFCGCGDSDSLPERDKTKSAEQQGLFRKFVVRRTDGSDAPGGKHDGCDYFVLDVTHDKHAKAALAAYAESVEETHPQLAADMRNRYKLAAPQQAEAVPTFDEQLREVAKRAIPQQAEAVPPDVEVIRKALERAFIMGQNYWADADSESYSANKRSDVTRQKFNAMRDEVCAAIAQQKGASHEKEAEV